jgi:hypothetical protein
MSLISLMAEVKETDELKSLLKGAAKALIDSGVSIKEIANTFKEGLMKSSHLNSLNPNSNATAIALLEDWFKNLPTSSNTKVDAGLQQLLGALNSNNNPNVIDLSSVGGGSLMGDSTIMDSDSFVMDQTPQPKYRYAQIRRK